MKIVLIILSIFLIPYIGNAQTIWKDNDYTWERGNPSLAIPIQELGDTKHETLRIPVLGVLKEDLKDTWGDARSKGRTHEGIDIFAPLGTPIVSPTKAVVTRIDYGGTGGTVLYTANGGGETFYYAHLQKIKEGIQVGSILKRGDVLGYVGNSGNAKGANPHLHFTIYNDGPLNPYPRLTKEFSKEDQEEVLSNEKNTKVLESIKEKNISTPKVTLNSKSKGDSVIWLQKYLIEKQSGPQAKKLASVGATGTFGPLTKSALIEFQKKEGITPSSGIYGPKTKAYIEKNL